MQNKYFISVLLFVISLHATLAQTTSFNNNWQFVGLEFASQQKVDSLRRLGNNWEDQFLETVARQNTVQSRADFWRDQTLVSRRAGKV